MILTTLVVVFSLHASAAEQTNPYFPYGTTYGSYSQYGTVYGSYDQYQPVKANGCNDPNWDGDCVCSQQKQKIDWVKRSEQPLNTFNWSKVRSKQVVMIGDEHGVSNPDSILDLINLSRSDRGKQCVFFEMSSDWSRDKFLNLLKEKTGDTEADRLRRYYGKIANGSAAQGFDLYMVDDPRNWSGDRNISDSEREIHMAETIKNLFNSKKCDHAIQIVGKAHVSGSNMSGALASDKISVAKLNPIWAPTGGRSAPTEEWNGLCKSQTYTPSEAMIFTNSGIKDDWVVPSFDPGQNNIRFGNFDYSILFPEAHFEQKSPSQTGYQATSAPGAVQ